MAPKILGGRAENAHPSIKTMVSNYYKWYMNYPITRERLREQSRCSARRYQAKLRAEQPEMMREKNVITSKIWHDRHKDEPEYRIVRRNNSRVWEHRRRAGKRWLKYAFYRLKAEAALKSCDVSSETGVVSPQEVAA